MYQIKPMNKVEIQNKHITKLIHVYIFSFLKKKKKKG